ncbi:LysM peptidoglycan-binding domain-containing protein [Candidatus Woesearchaeota archaeon]|nr:LysM peptidoglycan-binding domain-containing protein [Candidatus Woesearchaeota archaeon]
MRKLIPFIVGLCTVVGLSCGRTSITRKSTGDGGGSQAEKNYYIVKKGGSIDDIAKKTEIPAWSILNCNPELDENTKFGPGEKIKLYEKYYEIQPNDTLYGIALQNHANYGALIDLNNIENPDLILAGDKLRIPCPGKKSKHKLEREEKNHAYIERKEPRKTGYVVFPSGLKLQIVNDPKLTRKGKEFYDPRSSGNPLFKVEVKDLGRAVSRHFTLGDFLEIHVPRLESPNYKLKLNGDEYFAYGRLDPDFVGRLEKTRTCVGEPIEVDSGYRPWGYHKRIYRDIYGKMETKKSLHPSGMAADISSRSTRRLNRCVADIFNNSGIGTYDDEGFVHVDNRKGKARWSL